jgi:hypothetical protein
LNPTPECEELKRRYRALWEKRMTLLASGSAELGVTEQQLKMVEAAVLRTCGQKETSELLELQTQWML